MATSSNITEMENFSLYLDEFERHVKTSWQDLQFENNFCDVTLACEDKLILSHKFILSSCSPVLKNILLMNKNPHPVIYLRRVKYRDLQNLITFMYQGQVNVAQEDFHTFLEVAEDLNVRSLSQGNKVQVNSEIKSHPHEQRNSTPSPKRKRVFKDEDVDNINYDDTSVNESVQINESNNSVIKFENAVVKTNEKDGISSEKGDILSCGKCSKQFSSKLGLQFHYKSFHEGIRYFCKECDHKATTPSNLKTHVKSAHEGKRYPCDHCDYEATYQASLRTHISNRHNEQSNIKTQAKPAHEGKCYPCDHCDYEATTKVSLQTHISKRHNEQNKLSSRTTFLLNQFIQKH